MPLLAIALIAAPAAAAHEGRHDFESVIQAVVPADRAEGLEVRVLDYDEQIELLNETGETVIVKGYAGEPYARIEPGGPVYLNVRSPSLAPSNDRWGRTAPTGEEDAAAAPKWLLVGDGGRLTWYDRRSHFRGAGIPAAVREESRRQALWGYRIPLTVGGRPVAIEGTLYWLGRRPFPVAAFVFLLVASAGCAFFGAWAMRRLRGSSRPPSAAAADRRR